MWQVYYYLGKIPGPMLREGQPRAVDQDEGEKKEDVDEEHRHIHACTFRVSGIPGLSGGSLLKSIDHTNKWLAYSGLLICPNLHQA